MHGIAHKMLVRLENPVQYEMLLNDDKIALNPLIGTLIKLKHTGRIFCIHCNKLIKKTYNQGYCYPCFISLAASDLCIMKPETCHYAAGTCREPSWGEAFCFQSHIVYLANSSGIKVGITRRTQVPVRWLDQGATQALPIFQVVSRHVAGLIEVELAKHISDKTNWQQMLKSHAAAIDLAAQRDILITKCNDSIESIAEPLGVNAVNFLADERAVEITFPIAEYPLKIKSLCFLKTPEITGTLLGIKGQYLLLDSGVINIRKYTGFELEFSA